MKARKAAADRRALHYVMNIKSNVPNSIEPLYTALLIHTISGSTSVNECQYLLETFITNNSQSLDNW